MRGLRREMDALCARHLSILMGAPIYFVSRELGKMNGNGLHFGQCLASCRMALMIYRRDLEDLHGAMLLLDDKVGRYLASLHGTALGMDLTLIQRHLDFRVAAVKAEIVIAGMVLDAISRLEKIRALLPKK